MIHRIVVAITDGRQADADQIASDVVEVVVSSLPKDYAWPGNFRELEQCVWNVVIRKSYKPLRSVEGPVRSRLQDAVHSGRATAEEILNLYCERVYRQTGSYTATGRIVGLDQRTVKRRVTAAASE